MILLVCVRVCVCTPFYLTLCNIINCSLPVSSVHGIFQARIMVWVAISYSRGSSQPKDQICDLHLLHRQAGPLPLAPHNQHEIPQYSLGGPTSCSLMTQIGKKPEKRGICIRTAGSLCCKNSTALESSYLLLSSRQEVSDSLQPHGLQHASPPCPSHISENKTLFSENNVIINNKCIY